MCHRKFLPLFILLLFSLKGFSATFVVTSNADSGPGTLRDALTQAGTAEASNPSQINSITFNIADVSAAGRTITLISQLPDITSNLTIDGSTQPGTKFGVSDAKVALFYNTPVNQYLSALFVNNASNVGIYGLYIKNIADVSTANSDYYWRGIYIAGGGNIQIGAAGKGNVVVGFQEPLNTNDPLNENDLFKPTSGITIKDNIFSIDADGETVLPNLDFGVKVAYLTADANIGGTPAEGNTFAQGINVAPQLYGSQSITMNIDNNKIGVDYSVQTAISKYLGLDIGDGEPGGSEIYNVEDNVISNGQNQDNEYAITIESAWQTNILRNYIGTDKTLTKKFSTGGIYTYLANKVAIGSTNPADANYITNCKPVYVWPYSNVTVNKNSFFCTIDEFPMHDNDYGENTYPTVTILNSAVNGVSGTATPNSSVELFYSDKCETCSPQTFFASTTADNTGKWSYTGTITGTVIASATINGNTSEFTRTAIDSSQIKVNNMCSANGLGSITGAIPEGATIIQWFNQAGSLVGNSADLTNVPPGVYKLVVQNGACSASTSYYEIKAAFEVNDSQIVKTNPSCGLSNGSITGITVTNNSNGNTKLAWKDADGNVINNTTNLTKAPAGIYTLYISNSSNTCNITYGPVTLINATGPTIDQSQQTIQSTNCGQSTGSITNILITGGTGNYTYNWFNAQQQNVGTTKDLTGQPAGVYKLEVNDGGSCGPIYSTDIAIPETNGITLDETAASVNNATCQMSNGSVTGIVITGATTYMWADATGKTYITTTPDLTKAAAGTYTLTASNTYGCTMTSKSYTVTQPAPTQFPAYTVAQVEPCFGQNNGSITITPDDLVKSERWVNTQNNVSLSGVSITNLVAGTYSLYLTDQNGCETPTPYGTYTLITIPQLVIEDRGDVVNSKCGLTDGNINGLLVTGGVPPYTYQWTDASGNNIGTNSNDIANLISGTYGLTVTDSRCGSTTTTYSILDNTLDITTPSVSNIQLCSSGNIVIRVNNPDPTAVYRLYNSATGTTPIDEQTGGQFMVNVNSNTIFYITEVNGSCESSRAELKVTVGLSAINIANTFTPNGDGINDYWQINNIQNYPAALVQVFNRYGQKLFESRGYTKPFDGNYNGKPLPAGVYYYIINLSSNCHVLSGSITIVR